MWRVFDDVAFVDEAIVEAYASEEASVRAHLVSEALSRVSSIRLTAHLVAGYFGEDDVFTEILRDLHVDLSDIVESLMGIRSTLTGEPV